MLCQKPSCPSYTLRTGTSCGTSFASSVLRRLGLLTVTYDDDLRLAHVLADDADAQTMARFGSAELQVDTKPDETPVTDADRDVEELLRRTLERSRPRDSVVGEEYGTSGNAPRRWVIDPIDGTKNYVRGVPVWATLIALMVENEVVAGVVSAPALSRRWWAAKDSGAFRGKSIARATRCQVSDVDHVSSASFSYASLSGWEERGRLPDFLDLTRACARTRAYGDFWSYVMVADGSVDIAAEPEVSLHDMAAVCVVVSDAGGTCPQLSGAAGPLGAWALATCIPSYDGIHSG